MDTSQHKLGRCCNRIKSTYTFLFCILSAIHKLQNTCTTKPQSTNHSTMNSHAVTFFKTWTLYFFKSSKYMHVSKSGWFELPIYNLNYQCNSCLYLYHNKLVGFVLQEKEHTMPITLVPELWCLIIARLRTRGQFKVLSFGFDQFSQDFRLRLFSSKFLFSTILLWERNWWLLTFQFSSPS